MELQLALAQHADALPVFGDVRHVEEHAERPGHGAGLGHAQSGDPLGERSLGFGRTAATIAGQQPYGLDEFEGIGPRLFGNYLAEHVAQHADVAAEQIVTNQGKSRSSKGLGARCLRRISTPP